MTGEVDIAEGLRYLKDHCEKVGRTKPPAIILSSLTSPGEKPPASELVDRIGRYEEMGISGAALHVNGKTRAEWCDNVARTGADILSKLPK